MSVDTVVKRLEDVTARLEKLAGSIGSGAPAAAGGAAGSAEEDPASALAFDSYLQSYFQPWVETSNKIGGEVAEQAALVSEGMQFLRSMIVVASRSKKPAANKLQEGLKTGSEVITKVQDVASKGKRGDHGNLLAAIGEAIMFLAWVSIEPTPGPHVKECLASGQFWSNKVLVAQKGKDETQITWCKQFKEWMDEHFAYIKQWHTTGLTWNANGSDFDPSSVGGAAAPAAAPAKAAGGPPGPPPPAPPAGYFDNKSDQKKKPAGDMKAVFSQLNQGSAVTSGLRKVTDDMKTKNQKDRASVVPAKSAAAPKAKPKYGSAVAAKAKPPVFERQGPKWVIENQTGGQFTIDDTNAKQVVYMWKCTDTVVIVKGKVNHITMDSCKKCGIVFDDCVSGADLVNCTRGQLQMNGKCPNVQIDKCSGAAVYLSKESLECEIVSSKSDEMNVSVPKGSDGEFEEFPIPEQFRTVINADGKPETVSVTHG